MYRRNIVMFGRNTLPGRNNSINSSFKEFKESPGEYIYDFIGFAFAPTYFALMFWATWKVSRSVGEVLYEETRDHSRPRF